VRKQKISLSLFIFVGDTVKALSDIADKAASRNHGGTEDAEMLAPGARDFLGGIDSQDRRRRVRCVGIGIE
jgi:hypothetical protein